MEQAKAATAKRAYKRKTKDIYIIQQNFGYGDGWEDVNCEETWLEARRSLREYRENQSEYPVHIKKKRERIEEV